jgi:translocation and assembly module TamB
MIAGLTGALEATRPTPLGPVAARIGEAIGRSARNFNVAGGIRLANFPGAGGVRITDATVRTATGGRAQISGGRGITYNWPTGRLAFDGTLRMGGGGLPTGFVTLRQTPSGGMTGIGNFQPYTVNGTRLTLSTLRFNAEPSGATRFSTVANLTGGFPGGQVRNLNLPIDGRVGADGGILVGRECMVVSFDFLRFEELQLGRTRLPICPIGPAIIAQSPGGDLRVGGRIASPAIEGRIGSSRMRLNASSILATQTGFSGSDVALRIGGQRAPVILNAGTLRGNFAAGGLRGTLTNADAVIADIPIGMRDIDGTWQFANGRLAIDGSMLAYDREDPSRFYPLRSSDTRFVMDDGRITATGSLAPSGVRNARDERFGQSQSGNRRGAGNLDVPGIPFGPNLQPDDLTRLTEGVVALVRGTLTGRGRIQWSESGEVTSTGDFSTRNMDLAAPFGPVEGLTTTIHFQRPAQSRNAAGPDRPGAGSSIRAYPVRNGVIRYQILPDLLVRVERGEWPFMGGRLILHETILNFGTDAPKRLTFELVGFDQRCSSTASASKAWKSPALSTAYCR